MTTVVSAAPALREDETSASAQFGQALEALAALQPLARLGASTEHPSVSSAAVDRASATLDFFLCKVGAAPLRARSTEPIWTNGCSGAKPLAQHQSWSPEQAVAQLAAVLHPAARRYVLESGSCAQASALDKAAAVLVKAGHLPSGPGALYAVLARIARQRPDLGAMLYPCTA